MHTATAVAIGLELGSATLVNLAYVREQEAAAALPALSLRRPRESLRLLLTNRRWLGGFAMENVGFGLYVAALALAPLAIVQTVGAAGIGLLALASARASGRGVTARERWGALVSLVGLACLGLSLTRASGQGRGGSTGEILLWLGATGLVAAVVVRSASRRAGDNRAVFYGIAAGLLFSIGDITTKVMTQGGLRILFAPAMIAGYVLGTSMLQLGYQSASALTTAGVSTLLTNALPIAAGTALLGEPVPSGALGALRVVSFGAVVVGGVLLSRPNVKPPTTPKHR
jgi:drug/metabolite transporter (DMT)-like permease